MLFRSNRGGSPDAAHFLDCDMAILGALPARFAEYERQVALEYGHIDPALYQFGRRAFLEGVLGSPRIFLSDFFAQLEQRARDNIAAALAAA